MVAVLTSAGTGLPGWALPVTAAVIAGPVFCEVPVNCPRWLA
jgi:hypothetical protein